MKRIAAMSVLLCALTVQQAHAQKLFDKLDRLSNKVDRASDKIDRAEYSVNRAGNTADRAVTTGGKIVSLFRKKDRVKDSAATDDRRKHK